MAKLIQKLLFSIFTIALFASISLASQDKVSIINNFKTDLLSILNNLFSISKVEILGTQNLNKTEIKDLVFAGNKISIFSTSPFDVEKKIKSLPWVDTVKVRLTIYPAILRVNITESTPWIVVSNKKNLWLISSAGQLIKNIENSEQDLYQHLPRLKGIDDDNFSSSNQKLSSALQMLKILESAGGIKSETYCFNYIDGESLEIFNENSPITLLNVKNVEQVKLDLQRLELIKADVNSRNETPNLFDLRYENQIVAK
ncbi:MAG: FtsQ-type POTRA domain-containing protein [Proteobacteria bacterium]|nr:FtsQ-type POTRA domain-containing protein [Pseudomonadota bacterium]